jgi:dihydroflavonol-4-reductase
MPKKLLVTGATGFIASHCIVDLLNHGFAVKGTVRSLHRGEQIRTILRHHSNNTDRLEFVQAELTDHHCWEQAMQGCYGVIHLASPVPVIQPNDANEVIKPAREGTLNVLFRA